MADEIIIVDKGEITSFPYVHFVKGFRPWRMGQELIEQHPQIIPGRQITPGSEDPPLCSALQRDAWGSWALDFLLVDQRGIPTLVEKLAENRFRRAVIGQIINTQRMLQKPGRKENCAKKLLHTGARGKDIEIISQLINTGENDTDFWEIVEKTSSRAESGCLSHLMNCGRK